MNEYGIIIDTNQYAGNFERQMCAYITGVLGDCGVGHEHEREVAEFKYKIAQEPDEHGTHRPVVIYPTPGYFNHGMGGHYKDGDEKQAWLDYQEVTADYCKKHPTCTTLFSTSLQKYSAFFSVLIHTTELFDAKLAKLVLEKAKQFALLHEGMEIAGVRQYVKEYTITSPSYNL
jgi:hypothetical protein